jgi:hypothetical protein
VRAQRKQLSHDAVMAAVIGAVYLAYGIWLSNNDLVFPDAMSRVANGYYVLFSRDPHLAAIGFVWNPLPSLATIPLLALSPVIPVLATKAFAGILVCILSGVIAMVFARRIFVEFGVSPGWALTFTGVLAIQPLVLISSAAGASEAMLLATSLYTTLHLTKWLGRDDPWHLVHAGLGLGLAYLVRYEAAAAALAVTIVVFVLGLWRARQHGRAKSLAILDCFLVGSPFAAAFFIWALISKLVAGSWFETYTSAYGNTAQVTTARISIESITGSDLFTKLAYLSTQLFSVAPLALVFVVISGIIAWRRRDARVLAAAAVLGGILAFDEWAFLNGSSFGWLRFQFMAIPWGFLMAGYILGAVKVRNPMSKVKTATAWGMLVALLAPLPLAWGATLDPKLAREEALTIEAGRAGQYQVQAQVADYLDSLNLPNGSVITDVAYSFPIVLASRNPHQFVITPDRDFTTMLEDPLAKGVKYALMTGPLAAQADALSRRFPDLFDNGGGIAKLDREWVDGRGSQWRIYIFTYA